MKKTKYFFFLYFIFISYFCYANENYLTKTFNYKEIIKEIAPCGTPPLVEDELKYDIEADPWLLTKNSYLISVARERLEEAVKNKSLWKATKFTGTDYTVGRVGMGTFCFVDIYLDTEDFLNKKLNCVYRIRYRWHSKNAFIKYLLGNRDLINLPHRCEYQFKSYGQAKENEIVSSDISWAVESRFEFRNESQPFKKDNSAPKPPWPFDEFIGYALEGKYKNYTPYPCQEYAKILAANLPDGKVVKLKPTVVHVATRRRLHLNLDNEFGKISGDKGFGATSNYNQSVLNTIDTVDTYSADVLNIYRLVDKVTLNKQGKREKISGRLKRRLLNEIQKYWCGTFSEVEFEFERNVLSAINTELKDTKNIDNTKSLEDIKKAFVSDVKTMAAEVLFSLNKIGVKSVYSRTNKYSRDIERLLKWRSEH